MGVYTGVVRGRGEGGWLNSDNFSAQCLCYVMTGSVKCNVLNLTTDHSASIKFLDRLSERKGEREREGERRYSSTVVILLIVML